MRLSRLTSPTSCALHSEPDRQTQVAASPANAAAEHYGVPTPEGAGALQDLPNMRRSSARATRTPLARERGGSLPPPPRVDF